MIKMFTKKRKGFTLIELVVVIAILGILAAVAIPRLTSQTANAKASADAASLRTVESAISIAMAEGDLKLKSDGSGLIAGASADSATALTSAQVFAIIIPKYLDANPVSQVDKTKTVTISVTSGDITASY